jgi:hypothetical protein
VCVCVCITTANGPLWVNFYEGHRVRDTECVCVCMITKFDGHNQGLLVSQNFA